MKSLKKIYVSLILLLGLVITGQAQNGTHVILESGPSANYTNLIQQQTESLLAAINEFYETGEAEFPDTEGGLALRQLVEDASVRSNRDTLVTYMIQVGEGNYEVRKLFLQVGDQAYEFQELSLVFDPNGELLDARFAQELHNFERALNRGIEANEQEYERVAQVLSTFSNAFTNRDLETIERLLASDALIITGSQVGGPDDIRFMRLETDAYLDRIQTNTFDRNENVEVRFEDINIYRNALQRGVFAVSLFQIWNTTNYSDEGYMALMVDLRDEDNPKILARSWQPNEFEVGRYADIDPDPEPMVMDVQEVRDRLPGDTLSIAERLTRTQGYVTILVEADDPSLLSSSRLREWINEGILEITGVELDLDQMTEVAENELRIPFDSDVAEEDRFVRSGIEIYDTAFLESYSGVQSLVLQRDNVFVLTVTTQEEIEEAKKTREPAGELALTTLQSQSDVTVLDADSVQVFRLTMNDGVFFMNLAPGSYTASVESEGYHPATQTFEIEDEQQTAVRFNLDIIKGELLLASSQEDVTVTVFDASEKEVASETIEGNTGSVMLAPGSYLAEISKSGYQPEMISFDIVREEQTEIEVRLRKEGYEPGFFARNRLWIAAAAVAVAGSTAAVIISGGDSGAATASGLPPPPSRP